MMDLESPPGLRKVRTVHQEKRLRKRKELDALVREGGSRRRQTGGREELLYRDDDSSSEDSGQGKIQEGGGVTVWRPAATYSVTQSSRRQGLLWLGLRCGLALGLLVFLVSLVVWLHLNTTSDLQRLRSQLGSGEI